MERKAVITAEQACERLRTELAMRISPDTVRRGLEQRRFTFGDCITSEKSVQCFVYTRELDDWIAARKLV